MGRFLYFFMLNGIKDYEGKLPESVIMSPCNSQLKFRQSQLLNMYDTRGGNKMYILKFKIPSE